MSTDDTAGQARKGLLDSVAGKAKEMFGALSGSNSLTSEGQLQQRQARERKEANSTQAVADAQAQEAATTRESAQAGGRHRMAERAADAAESEAARARREAATLADDAEQP